MQKALKNIPVLALLPVLVYDVPLPLGQAASARALIMWVVQSPDLVPHKLPPPACGSESSATTHNRSEEDGF